MNAGASTLLASLVEATPEQLPAAIRLPTLTEARQARAPGLVEIRPPGSKSLTNRAILLAALAKGSSVLSNALTQADDAQQMMRAVESLGATVRVDGARLLIEGVDGRWQPRAIGDDGAVHLNLNNAGTAVRFLAGASLAAPCPVVIDGNARMRQRPIGELGQLLGVLGCGVTYGDAGRECPPVWITPPPVGGAIPAEVSVGSTLSSQFVSALLLVAPSLAKGMTVRFTGEVTSESYVQMTLSLLARLGVTVRSSSDMRIVRVSGRDEAGALSGFEYDVEPDATGATYFWAAGAMCGVPNLRCRVLGLDDQSLQGDSQFPDLLRRMGASVIHRSVGADRYIETECAPRLSPVLADMSDMPDAAMTLAAVAAFAHGNSIIRGLKTLRVKETDRIEAMRVELAKIGVRVTTDVAGDPDAITVTPPPHGVDCSADATEVRFDTYDDHRMAMSLALIALRRPNVWINHPACVAKTYPTYWKDFSRLYGAVPASV